jgi:hypothetical protein
VAANCQNDFPALPDWADAAGVFEIEEQEAST